jgi:hypothetical protein
MNCRADYVCARATKHERPISNNIGYSRLRCAMGCEVILHLPLWKISQPNVSWAEPASVSAVKGLADRLKRCARLDERSKDPGILLACAHVSWLVFIDRTYLALNDDEPLLITAPAANGGPSVRRA